MPTTDERRLVVMGLLPFAVLPPPDSGHPPRAIRDLAACLPCTRQIEQSYADIIVDLSVEMTHGEI
jgi:hypothetical protein